MLGGGGGEGGGGLLLLFVVGGGWRRLCAEDRSSLSGEDRSVPVGGGCAEDRS